MVSVNFLENNKNRCGLYQINTTLYKGYYSFFDEKHFKCIIGTEKTIKR